MVLLSKSREATNEVLAVRPEEAARRLSISRAHLYRLLQRGELASVRSGSVRLIPVEAIRDFLAKAAA
jgi:excisionase family DNA binding protein